LKRWPKPGARLPNKLPYRRHLEHQAMIHELRTYDFAPGDAVRYLDLFRREGLPLITGYLPLIGYLVTEIGPLNRIHHLWAYRDLTDRAERRGRFMQDKAWTEGFLPRGMALVRRQESRLLSLVQRSTALGQLTADADRKHAAQIGTEPLLGHGWFTVETAQPGSPSPIEAPFAHWTVTAGDQTGSTITLVRFDQPGSIPLTPSALTSREICRPAGFSPLN
jgi:NIPSNAP